MQLLEYIRSFTKHPKLVVRIGDQQQELFVVVYKFSKNEIFKILD